MATQIFFHVHLFTPTWWNDPIWRAYFSNGLVQPPNSINTSRRLESAPGPDTPRRNSALKVPWDLSWQLTPNSLVTSLGTHICIVNSIILLLQDFHVDLLWAWLWLLWSGKWKSFLVKQCWIWDKQLHFSGFGWYDEWDHFYESMTVVGWMGFSIQGMKEACDLILPVCLRMFVRFQVCVITPGIVTILYIAEL